MKIIALWLGVILSLFQVPGVMALDPTEEAITSFDSVIEINQDTSLSISEKIEYFSSAIFPRNTDGKDWSTLTQSPIFS